MLYKVRHTISLYNFWVHNQIKSSNLDSDNEISHHQFLKEEEDPTKTKRLSFFYFSFISSLHFHVSYIYTLLQHTSSHSFYFNPAFTSSYSIQALTALIFILSLMLTAQNKHPLAKGERYHIMILIYFTVGSTSSGSAFVIAPNLGAKILSEYFTGNAPPLYILDLLLGSDQPIFSCI